MPAPLPLAAVALFFIPGLISAMAQTQPQPSGDTIPAPLMTAPRAEDRATTLPARPLDSPLPPATADDVRHLTGRTVTTQDGKAQAVIQGSAGQDGAATGLILSIPDGRTVTVPVTVLRVSNDGSLTIAMTAEALAAAR